MGKGAKVRSGRIAGVVDDLRRIFQVVHGYSKRAERVAGLTGPQLWAVKVLAESSPIRVSELAKRMYLHPSTVVGILDRLESRGLTKRSRSLPDRRAVAVSLTGQGREFVAKTPAVAQGLILDGLEGLSEHDLRVISEGLELLVGILGAQKMPPQLLFSSEVNLPQSRPPRRMRGTWRRPPGGERNGMRG
jgi:DNA-binding MarR family transcriptional regulator